MRHDNIDLVCFDNYMPLTDWTTGDGGLDAQNWLESGAERLVAAVAGAHSTAWA